MKSRGEIMIKLVDPVLARLDPRATPDHLQRLVPRSVPGGQPVMVFEFP
jgi:hypothetical protein